MSLIYNKKGHIAYITLNRPEVHNALNAEMIVGLVNAWKDYRDDPDMRCAILTGAGEKTFCSGADLATLTTLFNGTRQPRSDAEERILSEPDLPGHAMLRDFEIHKPIVAAVNGSAIAGGMEFLHATDIRVSCRHAKYGLTEVKWATMAAGGSTARLPRQLPYVKAMELLLTAELISAEQALQIGYLNKVVDTAELMPEAERYANAVIKNGPFAVAATKRSVLQGLELTVSEALALESEINKQVMATEDAREGPRAFKEKREPNFTGR